MRYSSINDICIEFKIDSSKEISEIISELTKIQVSIHPDVNPNFSNKDLDTLSRIDEAKTYLRGIEKQTLVPIPDVMSIIKVIKNEDISTVQEIENAQININNTSQKLIKTIKNYYLPREITVAGVLGLISFIWAFPSTITQHPILGRIIEYETFYLFSTLLWFLVLILSLFLLSITYRNETYAKNILHDLENIDNQYHLFCKFINKLNDSKTFTNQDFEQELREKFCYNNRHSHHARYPIPKSLLASIQEIIPKISNMIILRALEKGIIVKVQQASWYDTYIVQNFD